MKMRNLLMFLLLVFLTLPIFGEGIKVNITNLKSHGTKYESQLSGASDLRLFTDFEGNHYIIGYYPGNRIKIVNIPEKTYLALIMKTKNLKENVVREARVPFIIYEFFSSEAYAFLILGTYSRYGINNASLNVATFPVMTAAGIIIPMIYTSNHEISFGECIHSLTSNLYLGGIGAATNYLISGTFEPLTTLLTAAAGNIGGYWMAKVKRYTPGQALVYDEVLQKTSYISLTASVVYQDTSVDSRIVAGSFLGATAVGAVSSYLIAEKYIDIKIGDILLLDGLSNSVSGSVTLLVGSFTDNIKAIFPVSYGMFAPGYYLGYRVLKSGHIRVQDGMLFNLGVYSGYLLGGAVDAILNINTSSGYDKLIGTAVGGMVSTFIMYNWIKNRTMKDVTDSKIVVKFNPIPLITYDKTLNKRIYSLRQLITINF